MANKARSLLTGKQEILLLSVFPSTHSDNQRCQEACLLCSLSPAFTQQFDIIWLGDPGPAATHALAELSLSTSVQALDNVQASMEFGRRPSSLLLPSSVMNPQANGSHLQDGLSLALAHASHGSSIAQLAESCSGPFFDILAGRSHVQDGLSINLKPV